MVRNPVNGCSFFRISYQAEDHFFFSHFKIYDGIFLKSDLYHLQLKVTDLFLLTVIITDAKCTVIGAKYYWFLKMPKPACRKLAWV